MTVRSLKLPKKEGPVQQRMKGLLLPKQRGANGGTVAVPLAGGGKASALSSSSPSSREQGLRLPSRLSRDGPNNPNADMTTAGEEDMLLEEVDIEGGGGRLSDTNNPAPDPSAAGGGGGWSLSLPGLSGSGGSGGGTLWWANNPFGNNSPNSEGYTPPANRRTRDRGGGSYYPADRDAELDTKKLNLDTLLKSDETDDMDPTIANGGDSFSNPYGAKYNGMDLDDPLTMSVIVERFIDSVLPGKELFETGIDVKDGDDDRQDLDRYSTVSNVITNFILLTLPIVSPALTFHFYGNPNPHLNIDLSLILIVPFPHLVTDSTWNMLKLLVRNHSLLSMCYYPGQRPTHLIEPPYRQILPALTINPPRPPTLSHFLSTHFTSNLILSNLIPSTLTTGMSGANTRTSRWFGVVHGLLISLFFDTLFFVTFFPPQNPCGNYGNSHTCHTLPSKIIEGSTQCVWDVDLKICYLQPPPSSIYFTLIVTLMVVLVIVPLEGFLGLIFEGFVVKRPDLEMWGMNTDSWFGSTQLPGTKVIITMFNMPIPYPSFPAPFF